MYISGIYVLLLIKPVMVMRSVVDEDGIRQQQAATMLGFMHQQMEQMKVCNFTDPCFSQAAWVCIIQAVMQERSGRSLS